MSKFTDRSIGITPSVRLPLWLASFFAVISLTMIIAGSQHAAAFGGAGGTCGINTGNLHDYAGAIVESVWQWPSGAQGGTSDNTDVKFTTVSVQTPGGNVVHLAGDHVTIINRQSSETFNQYDSNCGPAQTNGFGDGHNVVLGYDDGLSSNETSNYSGSGTGHTTDGTVWALDCDISRHASFFERFSVTGVGVPSGIPAGRTGSWNTVVTSGDTSGPGFVDAAANGQSVHIKLIFKLTPVPVPPPPPPVVGPVGPSGGYTLNLSCTHLDVRNNSETFGASALSTNTLVNMSGAAPGISTTFADPPGTGNGGGNGLVGFGASGSWDFAGPPGVGYTVSVTVYDIYHNPGPPSLWHRVVGSTTTQSVDCPAPTPPPNPPVGFLDGASCGGTVFGWAADPDFDTPLYVDIYANGAYFTTVIADQFRLDVGAHGFSADLSSLENGTDYTFTAVAHGVNFGGALDGLDAGLPSSGAFIGFTGCGQFHLQPSVSTAAFDNPEDPSSFCGTVNVVPSFLGWSGPPGGVPASASSAFTNNGNPIPGGGPFGGGLFLNQSASSCVGVGAVTAGALYCVTAEVTPTDGLVDRTGVILASSGDIVSLPGCDFVHNKPYFKAVNGDLRAGGNFTGVAGCTGGGTLGGWFHDSSSPNYGAGSTLASLALIRITGVASARGTTVSTPLLNPGGSGISFGNKAPAPLSSFLGHPDSPVLGGGYGASHCIDRPLPLLPTTPLGSVINISGLGSGSYSAAGPTTTINSGGIANGTNIAINVTGDVYITGGGGISYSGSGGGWAVSPTTTTNTVPSFTLSVTNGNIYIDAGVTQLDGIYTAANAGAAGGKIYTCASGFAPMPQTSIFAGCNKQLVINGVFQANQVNLMRTYGSLRDDKNPPILGGCANSPGFGLFPNCAAELFRFSPELYLSNQPIQPPGSGANLYDALVSLPPVL